MQTVKQATAKRFQDLKKKKKDATAVLKNKTSFLKPNIICLRSLLGEREAWQGGRSRPPSSQGHAIFCPPPTSQGPPDWEPRAGKGSRLSVHCSLPNTPSQV